MNKNPILVTGSHRSGTTWVGHMIALSPRVHYIHEPFNLSHRRGVCNAHFPYWFYYIDSHNGKEYRKVFQDTIDLRYNLKNEIHDVRFRSFPRDIGRLIRDRNRFAKARRKNQRVLLKDPIALLSAVWLAKEFDMQVVVMIRHPAGFISSIKRLNSTFDFSHFIKQPLLIDTFFPQYRQQIEQYAQEDHDIIDQGILLWNCLHKVIDTYRRTHNDWLFLRHEDVASYPLEAFESVYQFLDIDFTEDVKNSIETFSHTERKTDFKGKEDSIRRESKMAIDSWKKRLEASDIKRIRQGTEEVASLFYSEDLW